MPTATTSPSAAIVPVAPVFSTAERLALAGFLAGDSGLTRQAYELLPPHREARTLVFLLFISIVPWPTALASNYADQGVPQARAAAVLYAATMLMMGLSFTSGWRYLAAHPELVSEPARAAFPAGARRALLGGLVYLAAIAVAFLSPAASFAIDAIVAVYFAVSKSKVPGLIVRSADADGSS